MDNYLPLAYLNAWEYCQRRFYFEYVLGEMEINDHIIRGTHLHRNINEAGTSTEGDTRIHRQQWVWSDRLKVKGIIDAVEETDGLLIPLEYKKGKMGKHLNDHFQLCAAALCLEEKTGQEIPYGEIFYYGNRRRQQVEFTQTLRNLTEQAIMAAHLAGDRPMPLPLKNQKKCKDCSLKRLCLPKEIKQLTVNS
ncbi:CRISPR-associated protein Cas4 [[Limnothrix rosea] IAM M-220]|uniref:CRISPR-associated protein Cas4 n=1 Tax=[Limnothrix rosea] IAM M-220 TaxID=454133 RepID=UPI00095ABE38|nr:CRISPR-associated protein Cas4 [[Limnothrix rosea] IAM M-220]OKH17962.1 CRISPR-associated protein Cas4 [[Limnothrix rosea] IAM M-220]